MFNPKVISPLFHQNTKGALLRRIIPLSIIIGLLIFYKYFVELTYEIAFPSPNTPPINPVPTIPNITIPNINDDIEIDPLFTKKHENKFRVKLEELKEVYQVMDIIRIIIEPRHPSLANKLESTFFRVTITGTTIFTPQLVSSSNSSVLVYEAPLMDQGDYNVQVRMIFYDYKEIYSFESSDIPDPNLSPKVEKIDRVIINGEFKFKVEQSPVWARLKPELPESCADISVLRGRWTRDLSQFIPYSCIIPNYYTTTFLETDPKFISDNNNNLPFRYTWLRFLGDSNTRRLFSIVSRKLGTSCIKIQDGQNKDKNTQIFCKANYTQTKFLGEKDPRPREIYLTYEWYYPGSKYSLETLLNNTFEQTCKQHDKCMKNIECDFTNSTNNNSSKNICSTERADYTFISLGSHTPGWNIESIDKYLEGIFQQIHENYREKLTFITTNVANINKIPPYYKNQYLIRNNFRITKANELLKKYVDKSQKGGYNNIDLLDFFGTTKPIYEYSGDAVHYKDSVYNEQTRLVLDRLVNYIRTIH